MFKAAERKGQNFEPAPPVGLAANSLKSTGLRVDEFDDWRQVEVATLAIKPGSVRRKGLNHCETMASTRLCQHNWDGAGHISTTPHDLGSSIHWAHILPDSFRKEGRVDFSFFIRPPPPTSTSSEIVGRLLAPSFARRTVLNNQQNQSRGLKGVPARLPTWPRADRS